MSSEEIEVRFPANVQGLSQVDEFFFLVQNGQERKIRLHDYREIYRIPHLYERILADMLHCESPEVVSSLLIDALSREQSAVADLHVLELGAGTGMVGESLVRKGVRTMVGIDIVEEAAEAANRDRPGTYTSYYVEDVCNLSPTSRHELEALNLNCLVCVSALGLNHVPAKVFACAYNLIATHGWVTFNVNEDYLNNRAAGGFPLLVSRIIEEGLLEVKIEHPYRHRFSVDGSPINYVAMVGRKQANIPDEYQ